MDDEYRRVYEAGYKDGQKEMHDEYRRGYEVGYKDGQNSVVDTPEYKWVWGFAIIGFLLLVGSLQQCSGTDEYDPYGLDHKVITATKLTIPDPILRHLFWEEPDRFAVIETEPA